MPKKIEKWGRWSKLTCLYICVNMGNLVEKKVFNGLADTFLFWTCAYCKR